MRRKLWPIILSTLLPVSIACKEQIQRPDLKAQTVIEEGIRIIKNPEAPFYGHIDLEVEENLAIGNVEDENYFFFGFTFLDIDHQGNFYVLDGGNKRVQVFSNEGVYLRTIGRGGQGPGEFGLPDGVFVNDTNGVIYVPDTTRRRATVFSAEGSYAKSIPLEGLNRSFCIGPEGCILLERETRGQSETRAYFSDLVLIDQTNASEKVIESHPDQIAKVIEGSKAGFVHGYEHRFQFNTIEAKGFIWGFSSDYDLNVIDCQGSLLYRIQKDSPRISISEREKDIVRDRYRNSPIKDVNNIPFPDHKPLFGRILTDEGWIFVCHYRSPLETKPEHSLDVFDEQGYFLYTCNFPINPLLIKNGCAYLIDTSDETGDVRIIRYKIMNWNQLKKM
jgi:hypothetical protein